MSFSFADCARCLDFNLHRKQRLKAILYVLKMPNAFANVSVEKIEFVGGYLMAHGDLRNLTTSLCSTQC